MSRVRGSAARCNSEDSTPSQEVRFRLAHQSRLKSPLSVVKARACLASAWGARRFRGWLSPAQTGTKSRSFSIVTAQFCTFKRSNHGPIDHRAPTFAASLKLMERETRDTSGYLSLPSRFPRTERRQPTLAGDPGWTESRGPSLWPGHQYLRDALPDEPRQAGGSPELRPHVARKYLRLGSCRLEPISRMSPRSTRLSRRVRVARDVSSIALAISRVERPASPAKLSKIA
jgi:hypothetical protein